MLLATEANHPTEHAVFTAQSATEWTDLARERAAHSRRAIFIAHDAAATNFNGILWAYASHVENSIDLTWNWTDGSPGVMSVLVSHAHQWGVGLDRRHLRLAADDTREANLFLRLGFVEVGIAREGVRRVLASRPRHAPDP